VIEDNLIYSNNYDIYAADSDVPAGGPGYDFFRYPVGTGIWIVGGDDNEIRRNYIYDNERFGFILARNPLEQPTPEQPMVSEINRNATTANFVGVDEHGVLRPNSTAFPPGGDYAPGGSDFWWDETGMDNCWGPQDASSGPIKTDPPNALNPLGLPGPCPATSVGAGNPLKLEILANCAMDSSSPPHTNDVTYPCPWGQTNESPYGNRDVRECGNWTIERGEDCDDGYASSWSTPNLNGESCASLGHGSGTLACKDDCTWDFSGCEIGNATCGEASACGDYDIVKLQLSRLNAPAGDEIATLKAVGLSGTGRTFDPRTDAVAITLRDQSGAVHTAVVPAGTAWETRPTSAAPTRFVLKDRSGANGGVTLIKLKATSAAGFAGAFAAVVKLRGADLADAADARSATANLRIGNDCWESEAPCTRRARGNTALCRPAARTCSAS
jgi:hypothetical protein